MWLADLSRLVGHCGSAYNVYRLAPMQLACFVRAWVLQCQLQLLRKLQRSSIANIPVARITNTYLQANQEARILSTIVDLMRQSPDALPSARLAPQHFSRATIVMVLAPRALRALFLHHDPLVLLQNHHDCLVPYEEKLLLPRVGYALQLTDPSTKTAKWCLNRLALG